MEKYYACVFIWFVCQTGFTGFAGRSLVYKFLLFRSSGLNSFFGSFGLSGESFEKRPFNIAPPLELH
jgi:hypothetical protein